MNRPERRKGFTLVELLIVMAVIAILAAIAVPAYWTFIRKATMATMVADAKNAAMMEENLRIESAAYLAVAATAGPAVVPMGTGSITVGEGNTLAVTAGGSGIADSFIVIVSNPNAAPGKSPLTRTSAGQCAWADASPC